MNPNDIFLSSNGSGNIYGNTSRGQALNVRVLGIDTLVVDVMDPTGQPRELKFSIDKLPYRKATPTRSTNIIKFPSR
jgi:hypothetical protein